MFKLQPMMTLILLIATPVVLFPTYDAPKYKYGYQILILFGSLAITLVTTMKLLYRRKE